MTVKDDVTLATAWQRCLRADPGATALIDEGRLWTRADLDLYRTACLRVLERANARPGDRVMLMLDNGATFMAAFLACQSARVIAVPVSPKSSPERIGYLVADSGAHAILIASDLSPRLLEPHQGREYARLFVTLPGEGDGEGDTGEDYTECTSAECAFIQYTSGSTSASKGVMISHRAALANIAGLEAVMGLEQGRDVFSSMMPLFHDMGLVGFGLLPLLRGYPLALYRQEALSLYNWLQGIGQLRATITGAPDSLLHIANRVVERPADYPLGSLRMLICGSEPVRAATVRLFGERFGVSDAIKPAYGMAELTLCATATPANEAMRIDTFERVSSGRALQGVEIRIRDENGVVTQEPGVCGEILVRSPAAMSGYLGRPLESEAAFFQDGYLATGDSGHLDRDGWVYVVGRIKNLLIRGGEKYSPHDFETMALELPRVRRCAVVQLDDNVGKIVTVLELDRLALKEIGTIGEIGRGLVRAAHQRVGIAPDEIWFVSGGVLPTTENGKMRHALLRNWIMDGRLQPAAMWPPRAAVFGVSGESHVVDAV